MTGAQESYVIATHLALLNDSIAWALGCAAECRYCHFCKETLTVMDYVILFLLLELDGKADSASIILR